MSTRKKALSEIYLPTNYRAYGTGEEGLVLADVAKEVLKNGGTLTLDERFLKPGFKRVNYLDTPFKEIRNMWMHDKVNPKRIKILDKQQTLDNLHFQEIVLKLKKALKGYIVKVWNSKKKKLFLHSAGYDSRIISGILMELREEKGEEWIGDIHFRCHQPEAPMFIEIMKREGWRDDQWSLWEDFQGPENHYNLGRLEPVNGFMGIVQQYDFFSDITKGKEKDYIIIGGIYGGEMFDYPARGMGYFKNFKYCDNLLLRSLQNYMLYEGGTVSKYFNDHHYAIFPYLSYDYLEVATKMPNKYIKRRQNVAREFPDNVRLALLQTFKGIDLVNIPYGHHRYTWNITQDRWEEIQSFYEKSLFKKDTGIEIKTPFKLGGYHDSMWCLAVMYEQLYGKK